MIIIKVYLKLIQINRKIFFLLLDILYFLPQMKLKYQIRLQYHQLSIRQKTKQTELIILYL